MKKLAKENTLRFLRRAQEQVFHGSPNAGVLSAIIQLYEDLVPEDEAPGAPDDVVEEHTPHPFFDADEGSGGKGRCICGEYAACAVCMARVKSRKPDPAPPAAPTVDTPEVIEGALVASDAAYAESKERQPHASEVEHVRAGIRAARAYAPVPGGEVTRGDVDTVYDAYRRARDVDGKNATDAFTLALEAFVARRGTKAEVHADVVERCARAAYQADDMHQSDVGVGWEYEDAAITKAGYKTVARAVLTTAGYPWPETHVTRDRFDALQHDLQDRCAERDEARRETKQACVALADAFVPAEQRTGAHLQGLSTLVRHAVEHHDWHHDAQDTDYVRRLENERHDLGAEVERLTKERDGERAELGHVRAELRDTAAKLSALRSAPAPCAHADLLGPVTEEEKGELKTEWQNDFRDGWNYTEACLSALNHVLASRRARAGEPTVTEAEVAAGNVVKMARQLGTYDWESRLDDSAVSNDAKNDARELSYAVYEYDRAIEAAKVRAGKEGA